MRVIARNAQFVGDLANGAWVTIRDTETGEVLAQGKTRGAAGQPAKVMGVARKRGEAYAREADARFDASIDIKRPRHVTVSAYGPLNPRYEGNRAEQGQWIVPGRHQTGGDGWVIELAGLIVIPDVAASTVSLEDAANGIAIAAEVMPLCGCPIKPGFFWAPEDYEVAAIVHRSDAETGRFPLTYAGAPNEFETRFAPMMPGVYDVTVYAYNAGNGNTGVGTLRLTVVD